MKPSLFALATGIALMATLGATPAASADRARDLGILFDGRPGALNAITDVPGVEVGQTTLIRGQGKLEVGKGPVRTGVTIIHPLGRASTDAVAAGRAVINGTGEWTGMQLVDEAGLFFGPVALTGSGNVGIVHQSLQAWSLAHVPAPLLSTRVLPVVGETLDSRLNDVFGQPLTQGDVFAAIDGARGGPVAEGNVGGGTGMIAYTFKGGIGTASRIVETDGRHFTVGVLLQANHGRREDLRIAGIPVGAGIRGAWPEVNGIAALGPDAGKPQEKNSLLIVIGTDAPLLPHQLDRLARRAVLGVGRNGSTADNLSGEMVLAFSTTVVTSPGKPPRAAEPVSDLDSGTLNALFAAAVQATEEALVNQLLASETMTGANGVKVHALPRDQLVKLLKAHGRLTPRR